MHRSRSSWLTKSTAICRASAISLSESKQPCLVGQSSALKLRREGAPACHAATPLQAPPLLLATGYGRGDGSAAHHAQTRKGGVDCRLITTLAGCQPDPDILETGQVREEIVRLNTVVTGRSCGGDSRKSCPFHEMEPLLGCSNPAIRSRRVVYDTGRPLNGKNSPAATVMS